MEADLLPLDDPSESKADLIDAVLGAGSMFDDTHGIHADGVSLATPMLPDGWRSRLVAINNPNTNGVTGLCVEPHDLVIAKIAAGREKDLRFCQAAVRAGYVDLEVLVERVRITSLDATTRSRVEAWIDGRR